MDITKYRGYEIHTQYDDDAQSPRDDYRFGDMYCWHRSRDLGDHRNPADPEDILQDLVDTLSVGDQTAEEVLDQNVIKVMIYGYEHGGLALSSAPYACTFDSGILGFILITRDDIIGHGLDCPEIWTDEFRETIRGRLIEDIDIYAQFIAGDVYCGYIVDLTEDESREHTCGYFGDDQEASGLLPNLRDSVDYDIRTKRKAHMLRVKNWIRNKVPLQAREPFDPRIL